MSDTLSITIEGQTIKVPAHTSKAGNRWHCVSVNGSPRSYGVTIPALATDLPTEFQVNGETVTFETHGEGKEAVLTEDGDLSLPMVPLTSSKGDPKVRYSGPVEVDGVEYTLQVHVNRKSDKLWHLIAKAISGNTVSLADLD